MEQPIGADSTERQNSRDLGVVALMDRNNRVLFTFVNETRDIHQLRAMGNDIWAAADGVEQGDMDGIVGVMLALDGRICKFQTAVRGDLRITDAVDVVLLNGSVRQYDPTSDPKGQVLTVTTGYARNPDLNGDGIISAAERAGGTEAVRMPPYAGMGRPTAFKSVRNTGKQIYRIVWEAGVTGTFKSGTVQTKTGYLRWKTPEGLNALDRSFK